MSGWQLEGMILALFTALPWHWDKVGWHVLLTEIPIYLYIPIVYMRIYFIYFCVIMEKMNIQLYTRENIREMDVTLAADTSVV